MKHGARLTAPLGKTAGNLFLSLRRSYLIPMSESGKAQQKAVRQRRLSAALRENLKRRKAQARGRVAPAPEAERAGAPHDSAGIGADKPGRLLVPPRRQAGEG